MDEARQPTKIFGWVSVWQNIDEIGRKYYNFTCQRRYRVGMEFKSSKYFSCEDAYLLMADIDKAKDWINKQEGVHNAI